ncbi:MAG: hypothetical protein K8I02_09370, partial [Candidatus Methylomirabilis sp.]|nr:hypothetical protein [Deltaproteobacteria bacterium]
ATVFTTGSATERNFGVAERVAAMPAPAPDGALVSEREFDDYCVLRGEWSPPVFQEGTPPFFADADGGLIRLDGAGDPIVQDTRTSPFYVTIPKAAMPAAGFPMYQYLHGTGGTANQVWERGRRDEMGVREVGGGPARIAAGRGWAAASMGGWMSTEHLGDLLSLGGYIAYNFFNPRAMRDNFVQMASEYILFRRLLETLTIPAALCPEADASAAPDGRFRFNAGLWTIAGHSQGSYNAGMVTALDLKPFQGAVLPGAGGSWIQFALGPLDPPLSELLELLLDLEDDEHLDIWHPISTVFELAAGSANNVHYLPSIFRAPRPGRTPPHMIVIQGYKDLQTTTNLQRPVSVALGVDMVGPDAGPFPEGQILADILLAGGRQLDYGTQNNRAVPGIGPRTVVTVRYEEDGILEGHSVPFQREEPKHQYGCFLEDLARGRAPIIVEGVAEGGPCAP